MPEWMNAAMRASVTRMHAKTPLPAGFKRQIVFRISADDWPLLEDAAAEHGSIQAAILAGLHALTPTPAKLPPAAKPVPPAKRAATKPRKQPVAVPPPDAALDPDEEIRAREAAKILGIKTGTAAAYIRSGRIPGRYDDPPTWLGWVTTRRAVNDYARRRNRARG
jgi:hypothetical protein